MTDQLLFTIDGNVVGAWPGETIWQVAQREGINIPHLCWLPEPGYRADGNCRACMVEVEGERTLAASCIRKPTPDMVVKTATDRAVKARRMVMELLLADQPPREDSPDRVSKFWHWAEAQGIDTSRFPAHSILRPDLSHPAMAVNLDACIDCGLCVRACREVQVNDVIGMAFRNIGAKPVFDFDDPMGRSTCVACGECVQACPTGALMPKSIVDPITQHGTREVDREVHSVCPYCGVGCTLDLEIKDGHIIRVHPDREGPANHGQACVRGRFLVREAVHHPKRVLKPLVRKNGRLEETGWDEALQLVARRFAATAPQDIAVFGSAQDPCEDLFILRKFAREGLKTNNLSGVEAFSAPARLLETAAEQGIAPPLNGRISDIAKSRVILLFGNCPPMVGLEIHQAVKNGARLIVVGGKESPSIRCASAWLKIPGGKEFDLLTGLSKILAGEGHPQNGSGLKGEAEFKKHLQEFKISEAVASSGLPEEKLHRLAQLLEKRRPAAFLFNATFAEGPGGKANIVALWNLALQNQAMIIPLGLESNVRGALEIAAHFRDGAPSAREIGRSILGGAFKALYVCGHLPRTERSPAEFMVVQDSYLGDAGEFADVILPATTFVESEGTFVNMEGRLQKFGPAIAPSGEARPGWRIICDLAGTMGLPGFAYEAASAVFEAMAKTVPAFRGLNGLERKAETFVQEPAKDGRAFAGRTPSAEEAAPLYEHDQDGYKGLAMSRDIKSLNIVRGHK